MVRIQMNAIVSSRSTQNNTMNEQTTTILGTKELKKERQHQLVDILRIVCVQCMMHIHTK